MSLFEIDRRRTRPVKVGSVTIGGGAPVSVQGMTKTHTEDVAATLRQIRELAEIGCEIVRCAVPNRRAGRAVGRVVEGSPLPVVGDVHFDPALALLAIEQGVHGVRVNPGNMRDEEGLREVFRAAAARGIKVRIGMNSGSVRPRSGLEVMDEDSPPDVAEMMVNEALACCEVAESEGLRSIVLSLKASEVMPTVAAYRMAAERCDYPFHVGVTAAGPPGTSVIKSSIGIGTLLAEGIGDTIRVSMTGPPHDEVRAGLKMLQALGLRKPRGPQIVSCPTCGRCQIDLRSIVEQVSDRLKDCPVLAKVAIMGCVVNGPGEAADADVGVAGGRDFGFIFRGGKKIKKVHASRLVEALVAEVEKLG